MEKSFFSLRNIVVAVIAIVILVTLGSITKRIKVDAGMEAVLIDKPFFSIFGSGGVRQTPVSSGSTWVFYTTEDIMIDIRPEQKSEKFDDVITSDNVPVDFNAYIKLRVKEGLTPVLYSKLGSSWYENNLKEIFRTEIRDSVAKFPMTDLTTRQSLLNDIQKNVSKAMESFIQKNEYPIVMMEVIIGKVSPPEQIMTALSDTASQQQRAKTEDERAKAEIQRKDAEKRRAEADNAYRNSIGLNPSQFIELEAIKAYERAATACANSNKGTCIIGQPPGSMVLPLK